MNRMKFASNPFVVVTIQTFTVAMCNSKYLEQQKVKKNIL